MLQLDHVFALVGDPENAVARLQADGWILDAGQAHPGQGTRNRRLRWRGLFFELVWIIDANEATANVLGLGRRATSAGASPFGIAMRGWLEPAQLSAYWLYDALGLRIWIHRDNESAPERPMLLVLETDQQQMEARRRLLGGDATITQPAGELQEIRLQGPALSRLPRYAGPPIVQARGPHSMELVVSGEGRPLHVTSGLSIRRTPAPPWTKA